MKVLTILLAIFFSLQAWAVAPSVGDKVVFKQKTNNPHMAKFTSWELDEIDHDLELYFYDVNSRYLDGWMESGVSTLDHRSIDQLYFLANNITDFCDMHAGEWEEVQVIAGDFRACKVRHNRAVTWWYSDLVPLGVIKTRERQRGNLVVYELKSFRFGKEEENSDE